MLGLICHQRKSIYAKRVSLSGTQNTAGWAYSLIYLKVGWYRAQHPNQFARLLTAQLLRAIYLFHLFLTVLHSTVLFPFCPYRAQPPPTLHILSSVTNFHLPSYCQLLTRTLQSLRSMPFFSLPSLLSELPTHLFIPTPSSFSSTDTHPISLPPHLPTSYRCPSIPFPSILTPSCSEFPNPSQTTPLPPSPPTPDHLFCGWNLSHSSHLFRRTQNLATCL